LQARFGLSGASPERHIPQPIKLGSRISALRRGVRSAVLAGEIAWKQRSPDSLTRAIDAEGGAMNRRDMRTLSQNVISRLAQQ